MSLLKPKIFLPLCIAGILTGYGTAEYIVPRYFHPTPDTTLTAQDIIATIGQQPNYFRQTTSGSYLAGQHAQRSKDWEKAAEYMGRVLKREKDNPDLQKHGMILSMAAGNVEDSIVIARDVMVEDPSNILAVLFTSLEAIKKEDYTSAIETFDKIEQGNMTAFIVPALRLWATAGQDKFDLSPLSENSFYAYQALLVGLHLNKKEEALAFADKAFVAQENDLRDLEKYADAFLAFGKVQKALSLYDLLEEQNYASKELKDKIKRLRTNQALENSIEMPKILSAKDGIALVFQDMAEILLREFSDDSATIFSQMSSYLNPSLSKNYAMIGEVYKRHDRYEDAIETLQKIDDKDKSYSKVQRQIAQLYSEQGKDEEAIAILKKLHKSHEDLEALVQIGDIYRYKEDYKKAEATYTSILNKWDTMPAEYWHVIYARGMCLERLEKFDEAEADLEQALAFQPNNPYVLNYLGYSWVDQGIHLDKSLKMIAKAVSILPNDGYITDSLGWVYYKMGKYDASVPHLERAVALLPYDATINDHLGDAYWKVGRRNEAKFQWQRALNYNENKDEELKQQIEMKLVSGITNNIEISQAETETAPSTDIDVKSAPTDDNTAE